MHEAAFYGAVGTVDLLLRLGADANALNCDDETPLHRACGIGVWKLPSGPATNFSSAESVRHLIDNGADVTRKDSSGRTALRVAIEGGRKDLVGLLRQYGSPED